MMVKLYAFWNEGKISNNIYCLLFFILSGTKWGARNSGLPLTSLFYLSYLTSIFFILYSIYHFILGLIIEGALKIKYGKFWIDACKTLEKAGIIVYIGF